MRDYLVVANQTLGGEHLLQSLRERLAIGPSRFHVVVPATQPTDHIWTEGEINAVAASRLEAALAAFRDLGAEADGTVGDPNPLLAIEDAFRERRFDEIILSTLPPGVSKWLRLDLPGRVAAKFDVPVTHVVSEPAPEDAERSVS
jgi:GABA permease